MSTSPVSDPAQSAPPIPWKRLLLLLLVALALRLWGVTFGLPYDYHFDESVYRSTALSFSWEKIHPHFGPFQIFVLAQYAVLRSAFVGLGEMGLVSPEVAAALALPGMSFQVLARWNSAFLGALSVIPVFLIGRRLWSPRAGWCAAFFLTFCYLHVRNSHFGVPDAAATFLTLLTAYFGTRLSPQGRWADYLWAGLFAGLALPTKQLSWPILVLLFLCHAFPEEGRVGWRRTILSGRLIVMYAVAGVVALLTSPQLLLHFEETYKFWQSAAQLGASGGMGKIQLDEGPRWFFYFTTMRWGMGDLMLFLSLAGVAWALAGRRRRVLVLLSFPVLFFAFLFKPGNMYFARYALIGVPFLLLPAGALLAALLEKLPSRDQARTAVTALALAAIVAQPAVSIVRYNRLMGQEDTRTLAKRWIEENVPDGSSVMLEFWWFGPQLASERMQTPFSERTYSLRMGGPYGLSEMLDENGAPVRASVERYVESGVQYVVSDSYNSGSHLINPEEDLEKRAFYESLDQEAELLQEFSPVREGAVVPRIFEQTYGPATHLELLERPGPVLKIYRLPDPEAEPEETEPEDGPE